MEKRTLLDVFDDAFCHELRQCRTNPEAYERASERFEKEHGFEPFSNYESFKQKKLYRRKKSKDRRNRSLPQ